MHKGLLYLPRDGTVFKLCEDWITRIRLRLGYEANPKNAEKYGVKLHSITPPNSMSMFDALYVIPAESKFVFYIKLQEYRLEFTKKLNPNGPYNILVTSRFLTPPIVEEV